MGEDKSIATFIASVPQVTQLSQRTHILLVAYYLYNSGSKDFSPIVLKNSFLKARLPFPDKIDNNLAELSSGSNPPLLRLKDNKYVLSIYGDNELKAYLKDKPGVETGVGILKELLTKIKNENQRTFLSEAIVCAEKRAYRASIIMTWLFVMDHLQEYILNSKKKLQDFNTAMSKRTDTKKLSIQAKDDFADLREGVSIEIMHSAGIITKGIKKILLNKLDTRNDCAHPSDIIIREITVVEFIDTLVNNVIAKYT